MEKEIIVSYSKEWTYELMATNANVVKACIAVARNPDKYTDLESNLSNEHITIRGKRIRFDDVITCELTPQILNDHTIESKLKPVHEDGWRYDYFHKRYHYYGAGFKDKQDMWKTLLAVLGNPEAILLRRVAWN
jgi:hypothetical protein